MKKSRLNLFRVTSMTISLLGVLILIATILVFAYIGIDKISSSISSGVDSGTYYDELGTLQSEYSALKYQFDSVKSEVNQGSDAALKKQYVNAELDLVKAKSAIDDVESALSTNKPASEVESRIKVAKSQLLAAKQSLSDLREQM